MVVECGRWLSGEVNSGVGFHWLWLVGVREGSGRLMAHRLKNDGATTPWGERKAKGWWVGWILLVKVVEVVDGLWLQKVSSPW